VLTSDRGLLRKFVMRSCQPRACVWMVILGLVALLGPAPAAQNQNGTPYAASRLIGRWRTVMNRTLEEARAFAAEDVSDLMEVFVSPGAVRAVQDKASEDQLKKIDAVLERFVYAMVKASTKRPDGSVVVEATAIDPAGQSICPVYPFCDR
jgi:hypothetical protein